jgi:cyanophycin synthetase
MWLTSLDEESPFIKKLSAEGKILLPFMRMDLSQSKGEWKIRIERATHVPLTLVEKPNS